MDSKEVVKASDAPDPNHRASILKDEFHHFVKGIMPRMGQARITLLFCGVIVLVMIVMFIHHDVFTFLLLAPENELSKDFHMGWTGSLFTYAFVHGGLLHCVKSILSIIVVGLLLEPHIGRLKTAIVYLAGILATGVLWLLVASYPLVGASGAVFAAVGALLFVLHRNRSRINLTESLAMGLIASMFILTRLMAPESYPRTVLIGLPVGYVIVWLFARRGQMETSHGTQ